MQNPDRQQRITGLIIGTAVGDAVGLPAEGLSRQAIRQLGWNSWRHRFIFGQGMVSDDTEHTLFVAQALLTAGNNPDRFERSLAWKLRLWLLSLPAGIGMATGRAIIKLWLGFPPHLSGVFSAGNGPAMRSAIIGAQYADDDARLKTFVHRSTRLTHSDPKAEIGALAIAIAAAFAINGKGRDDFIGLFQQWRAISHEVDWQQIVTALEQALERKISVDDFAKELGQEDGIGGYIYHTVPIALYSWLLHFGHFENTLTAVLDCGGDTDTVGAITGALAGAVSGIEQIPTEWINRIVEWPRSISILTTVAEKLADEPSQSKRKPVRYFWPGIVIRNSFFLFIVLIHGFIRLIPIKLRRYLFSKDD